MRRSSILFSLIASATLMCSQVYANEPVERTNATAIWFENWGDLSNASLTISSPDGTIQTINSDRGTPVFNLRDLEKVEDGVYNYELSAATSEKVEIKNALDNGRGAAAKKETFVPFQTNGFFIVSRGVIAKQGQIKEE